MTMTASDPQTRRALLAKIHATKKAVGLDDDAYRAKLTALTGKDSCKAMSLVELEKVARAFVAAPIAKPSRKKFRHGPRTGPAAKATAIWINLANHGVVEDRSDAALAAFIRRQTGQEIGLLDQSQWTAVIRALMDWQEREGLTP